MFRSIRTRLVLWYTGILVITYMLATWSVKELVSKTLSESLDQSLTGQLNWMVARTVPRIGKSPLDDETIRNDIFEHAAYFPIKEYIEIYDSTGKVYYRSPNLESDTLRRLIGASSEQVAQMSTVTTFRNHAIRLALQRTPAATIYVAMPTESVTVPIDHLFETILWSIPLVILVSVAGGIYLANKSFSKVNRVIDAAKSITADRLSDRIPEHNVQDEIGRLISTYNEMIARLDFSFQQIKQFSADASHELRTPLAVIRAQLESALADRVTPAQMKKVVANCLDESLHMSSIIDDLLLLSKADAGHANIQLLPVNLKRQIEELHEEATVLAAQRSIHVTLSHLDEAMVLGDEKRLRQMLLNLVDNAIKYNRRRGTIDLRLFSDNGSAKIIIEDSGMGIPGEDISRIFDRFYRVDKARERRIGGSGLGLAIVKWIAEAHHGSITVTSMPEKGSMFTIILPRLAPEES